MEEKKLRFDHRMPDWLHSRLCNYLQRVMPSGPKDCRGNMQHTIAFLREHYFDVAEGLDWLNEHSAHCDCEVVLNTHPFIDLAEA